jgi:hypothetical protein
VLKLNSEGGVLVVKYKIMVWMDSKDEVVLWGAECLEIPYQLTHFENGDIRVKSHRYYPDFYRMRMSDGSLKDVVMEVKPQKNMKWF